MSSPAYCWSPSTAPTASTNCSRYATSAIPEEKGRSSRLPVNHVGRGHEPVTVVGRTRSFVAVSMEVLPFVAVADYVPRRPKLANLVRLVECRPSFLGTEPGSVSEPGSQVSPCPGDAPPPPGSIRFATPCNGRQPPSSS